MLLHFFDAILIFFVLFAFLFFFQRFLTPFLRLFFLSRHVSFRHFHSSLHFLLTFSRFRAPRLTFQTVLFRASPFFFTFL